MLFVPLLTFSFFFLYQRRTDKINKTNASNAPNIIPATKKNMIMLFYSMFGFLAALPLQSFSFDSIKVAIRHLP